ncbi:nuclear transport factor 2 family protein [Streptomyces albicerus]|uniref:nuclear transport factor 2 family protein n=1 Tax=Streptomyces albicerus TaxID=2569859 RepID=UPI001CEDD4D7|nr:nuclear transport factor 2 family protein [Streptomyces albicerus]
MATCFADDSIVQMSWFTGSGADFVRQTRAMAGRDDHAVHRLSPPAVRIDGDRALVELPLVIEWRINIDGVEADLASACRSQYRAQGGTDGLWRIAQITSIYEKDTLVPVLPGTRLAVDPAGYRPSYRFLAWYPNRKGYTVGDHHLGDDQPDAVAAQYRTEHTWLHQSPTTPATSADPRREQHS